MISCVLESAAGEEITSFLLPSPGAAGARHSYLWEGSMFCSNPIRVGEEGKWRRVRRENEGVEISDVAAPSRATGRSPLLKYLEDVNDGLYSWLSRKPA